MAPRPTYTLELETGDALDVREFTIDDSLSSPFSIDIMARSEDAAIDFEALIGAAGTFRIPLDPLRSGGSDARVWTGVIAEVHQVQEEEDGLSTYQVTLVPRLWALTRRTNCRVFQQMTDLAIVRALLAEWSIDPVVEVTYTLKSRKYRVQYQESDLAFMSRLLEASGITFYYRQIDGESRLVLADGPQSADARKSPLQHVNDADGQDQHATGFRASRVVRPGRVTFADHDHRLPNRPLLADASSGATAFEDKLEQFVYEPGAFRFGAPGSADTPSADDRGRTRTDPAEAKRIAEQAAHAHRARSQRFAFETNVLDVAPGMVLSISGHARAERHPRLLVTRVTMSGTSETGVSSACHAVDASTPYRPEMITPRPMIHGVETATVVGPSGETIHTDEFGRVRVQFHWDRYGTMDESSSCWVHVNQPWAGDASGAINLPRIGQEVIVSFLGGSPEEPMILGRFFTNLMRPPFALPANKTQNGFKSASVPATGGYNELMFEDAAGKELLNIQAERNMTTLVKNDDDTIIGQHRTTLVKANDTRTVQGDRATTVGGGQTENVLGQVVQSIGKDLLTSVGSNLASFAGGSRVLGTGGEFASQALAHAITSQTSTVVTVGASTIWIGPDAVIIQSPKVLINPGEDVLATAVATGQVPSPGGE